jgi:hypothetical protein
MKKITALLLILLLFACALQPETPAVETRPAPEPPVQTVEVEAEEAAPVLEEDIPTPPQEVPLYNDYHVSLEIDPETRIVKGIERVRFTNHTGFTLDTVVMRLYLNAFMPSYEPPPFFPRYEDRIFRYGPDYGYMEILHVSMDKDELVYEMDGTVLSIYLDQPLDAEQTVQFLLQFEAYVPKIAHRTGANHHAVWLGMFLPVLSVHDGKSWDVSPYYPAGDPFLLETANYTVLVTTPADYIVAGSGIKKEDMMEDKKVTTFNARMTRDFALAFSKSFSLAETATESGVSVQFYYYSDNLRVDEILSIAKNSMEYFEAKVGAYPYGHVCIVETDMFVNGMEFSKIVFMDSAYLRQTRNYSSLVHELGHQWFYNVVGNNPITEAWLDEGMTLYIQEGFFHDSLDSFHEKMQNEYYAFKARPGKFIIASELSAFDNWQDYYLTHYTKAKLMLYALNLRMGDDIFWQCVNQYYQAHSFRIATMADFIAIAESVYGERLQGFFAEWLFGDYLPELG